LWFEEGYGLCVLVWTWLSFLEGATLSSSSSSSSLLLLLSLEKCALIKIGSEIGYGFQEVRHPPHPNFREYFPGRIFFLRPLQDGGQLMFLAENQFSAVS